MIETNKVSPNPRTQTTGTNPLTSLLTSQGWSEHPLGYYRSSGQIKEKNGFLLYIRRRNLQQLIDNLSKKSSPEHLTTPCKTGTFQKGSTSPMGSPEQKMTPSSCVNDISPTSCSSKREKLPALSSFQDYPSLRAVREDKPCLLIGYDSEWQTTPTGRDMLSWQFALVDGTDLVEFVFLKDGSKNLSLDIALGCILDHLNIANPIDVRTIYRYKYCADWINDVPIEVITSDKKEAIENCQYVYRSQKGFTKELIYSMPDCKKKRSERDWAYFHKYNDYSSVKRINITFVCHAGMGDLSGLDYGENNILTHLTDIQGGLVSMNSIYFAPKSLRNVNNTRLYPVTLSVSDTMCHAPAGKKKLEDLGKVLGIEKVEIGQECKNNMKQFFVENSTQFLEYASTDSVITMLYASAMYGYNNSMPVTITSATAKVMKKTMMDYLGCKSTENFNRIYRGLELVRHGKVRSENRAGFVEATSLDPISNDANTIQQYASQAYHGGYNSCSEVGYFPFDTYDYDLRNAYPTAMCLVPDINWENPIQHEIIRRELTLDDFMEMNAINPIAAFVGYINFEFPKSCKFPCIPVNVDGVPVYPLSSHGLNGVYVAGPYIWLALRLGARVYCDRGYFLNIRYAKDYAKKSLSLAAAVKQLVVDRNFAKHNKGKDSLEELILKTMVNAGYGKTAQNVVQKSSWSAYKDSMEILGCSVITNPFSAMMTTSIVQVELIAAQNQIHDLGYMSCSVTTDGFISNCPEDILKTLDLYGLRKFMESARIYLTDSDPEIWEMKHRQNDLVNFTTRGNVSLSEKGVCAHNSFKTGAEEDSYKDRFILMTTVLSRTGSVPYKDNVWTTFKDLMHGKPFIVDQKETHIRMDFDMKRKPIQESFTTDVVSVEGVAYEIAHFDTMPFENVEEFQYYRAKKALTTVLRTESDWDAFWLKILLRGSNAQPRDLEWSILNSCIMGYRCELWDIPGLKDKTIDEKCEWINAHNSSGKSFKPSDWKNARRPERQANMLPYERIQAKLSELMNATP